MKTGRSRHWRRDLTGYLFILPNLLGFLVFTSLPVVASLLLAFTHWDIISEPEFAGLDNFRKLAGDVQFRYYLWNTIFLMIGIPLSMGLSLGIALIMNQRLRGIVVFRTVFFLPSIVAGVAIFILWMRIYDPATGLLNQFLAWIGIERFLSWFGMELPNWLGPGWSKPSLIAMGLWAGMGGFNMILYLAGLQNIDPSLYEAAEIDGANAWQKFRTITWPLLAPTTFFIFITSCIGGFQGGFEQAYIMTGGGPFVEVETAAGYINVGATTTLGYYIFTNAYQFLKMGYAAAVAWFLFLIVFLVTIVNWKYGGRKVEYH